MKKHTALTMALLITLGGLAACSEKKDARTENESTAQLAREINEFSNTPVTDSRTVTFIGEEKAKALIAARAGFAVASIDFKTFELDEDYGLWKYETQFSYNGILYETEINAENGEIIKWEESEIE